MTTSTTQPLLQVENLSIHSGGRQLVKEINFDILPGERLGLIGESGSGKSLTCLSLIGLLDSGLTAQGRIGLRSPGSAAVEDASELPSLDMLSADEDQLAKIRGNRLSMVFQEPMTALNPLMKVGAQLREAIKLHRPGAKELHTEVIELLSSVKIPEPARAAEAFPHQMSGGQRQRVMLAMAMANGPDLLIADEPTTALDATVQKSVLNLMAEHVERAGSSLLFISHDLGVVSELCQRVIIMREGQIVEHGSIDHVFSAPEHPYTRALLAASALETHPATGRLLTLETSSDSATPPVPPARTCAEVTETGDHRTEHLTDTDSRIYNYAPEPALSVRGLSRTYGKSGIFGRGRRVEALQEVSFDVSIGQRFGIVGESGCGKSTLLRLLTALDEPTAGTVDVMGETITGKKERHLRWLRETVQIIFQDPMGSLNPRMKVEDIIAEPLRHTERGTRRQRVHDLLDQVGLPRSCVGKHPHQFSGGQRQRIAIARALVTEPKILVADEAVSALDVSVRAQILNLLEDLVDQYQLTLVFVSHDLNVVRHSCEAVAVMHSGRIIECGPTDAVFSTPKHSYTENLLQSIPRLRNGAV